MDKSVDSADMSLEDIGMNSKDLLDKTEIDCGGFGKVFLCCHKKHGLVVLKTVFTGCKQDSYKNDLLQEGKIMCKLNHERVVKLLGVILEDGNYSLVIEYMTKGNLLNVLTKIVVPISVKARFIMEIIEGMIYLHSQKVIHKDLKPENILADDDFHVKIADLGVAAFQKWSTLTKEETKRQKSQSKKTSSSKASSGGTLSYMAPEHFKNINKKASEKSDVYSFGIVLWVILSDSEPYENVLSNDQLSLCVKAGQRPNVTEDIKASLQEAAKLMEECWKDEPDERPSFDDCEKQFRPVYSEKYEENIERDITKLQKDYPEPEAFIQRMASLQIDCDAEDPSLPVRDTPRSLHSSLGLGHENVNENLFRPSNEPEESEEEKVNENLQRKLGEEMYYHQTGSHIDNVANPSNPDAVSELRSRKVFHEPCDMYPQTPGNFTPFNGPQIPEQSPQVGPGYNYHYPEYSPGAYGPNPNNVGYALPNEHQRMPNSHLFDKSSITPEPVANRYEQSWQGLHGSVPYDSTKVPVAESGMPSPYPQYGTYPYASGVSHTGGTPGNTGFSKGNFGFSSTYAPSSYISGLREADKLVNLTISNSRAIQIGNGNYMSIVESPGRSRHIAPNQDHNQYKHEFENNALVNEHQHRLLRENLSKKWKEFAREVGFRQPEIEEIDHDYERDGLKEKVFQMLYKWKMKEGSINATVGKVAKALYALDEKGLLNELIQLN